MTRCCHSDSSYCHWEEKTTYVCALSNLIGENRSWLICARFWSQALCMPHKCSTTELTKLERLSCVCNLYKPGMSVWQMATFQCHTDLRSARQGTGESQRKSGHPRVVMGKRWGKACLWSWREKPKAGKTTPMDAETAISMQKEPSLTINACYVLLDINPPYSFLVKRINPAEIACHLNCDNSTASKFRSL